jgi:ABC-type nitrate/sulfonate/bicarbonate transport system permease component
MSATVMHAPVGRSLWVRLSGNASAARLGVVVIMLLLWEIWARIWGDPLFMCPPSEVVGGITTIIVNKGVLAALGGAFFELVTGFAIAVGLGVSFGLVLGLSRFWYAALFPIVLMLYAIPQSTVLPLFILMLGVGAKAKIVFGITHSLFAVILTMVAGARSVEPVLLRCARSMGASQRQILLHVVLPSVVPSLFTAMRLAMAGTLLGVLLAELYVSSAGVGFYTTQFSSAFQPAKLFALIALLAAMAVVLNELCRVFEDRFNRWKA